MSDPDDTAVPPSPSGGGSRSWPVVVWILSPIAAILGSATVAFRGLVLAQRLTDAHLAVPVTLWVLVATPLTVAVSLGLVIWLRGIEDRRSTPSIRLSRLKAEEEALQQLEIELAISRLTSNGERRKAVDQQLARTRAAIRSLADLDRAPTRAEWHRSGTSLGVVVAAVATAVVGLTALAFVFALLGRGSPLQATGFYLTLLVLSLLGVASLLAVPFYRSRRPRRGRSDLDSRLGPALETLLPLSSFKDVSELATWLLREVQEETREANVAGGRWFKISVVLAGSTAIFSGAAGVVGLLDNPPTALRVTFALLALLGAGLAALGAVLGATQRATLLKARSDGLQLLARDVEFSLRSGELGPGKGDVIATFFERFKQLLATGPEETTGDGSGSGGVRGATETADLSGVVASQSGPM
jgi:hypothetical protein